MTHSKGSGQAATSFDRQPGRLFPPPRGKVAGGRMGGLGFARSQRSFQLSPPNRGGRSFWPCGSQFRSTAGQALPPSAGEGGRRPDGGAGICEEPAILSIEPPSGAGAPPPPQGGRSFRPCSNQFRSTAGQALPPSAGEGGRRPDGGAGICEEPAILSTEPPSGAGAPPPPRGGRSFWPCGSQFRSTAGQALPPSAGEGGRRPDGGAGICEEPAILSTEPPPALARHLPRGGGGAPVHA